MDGAGKSLRAVANKWLALWPETMVEVKRCAHGREGQRRCVYIRAMGVAGELGLFFFRHDDGAWYIFPPSEARPAIRILREAA